MLISSMTFAAFWVVMAWENETSDSTVKGKNREGRIFLIHNGNFAFPELDCVNWELAAFNAKLRHHWSDSPRSHSLLKLWARFMFYKNDSDSFFNQFMQVEISECCLFPIRKQKSRSENRFIALTFQREKQNKLAFARHWHLQEQTGMDLPNFLDNKNW